MKKRQTIVLVNKQTGTVRQTFRNECDMDDFKCAQIQLSNMLFWIRK